ncbi:MAG: pyridoxal phosphate-dependent aminotransferase [bacterium]
MTLWRREEDDGARLTRIRFADRAVKTPPSGIREIVHLALQLQQRGRDIIRLEVGESNDGTLPFITQVALADALGGQTRYTASAGQMELRQALAAKLARVNGIQVAPENVVVTVGAVQGLWLALAAFCNPDDDVLIPDPGWPNYEMIATLIGARVRRYRCDPARGFLPDPTEVRQGIGPRTRALVINSPQNPSGAVYPSALIQDLVTIAEEHNIVLISDEAYDELYFDTPPLSPARLIPVENGRWVATFSLSKTYAMTGWRVGYLVGSSDMAALTAKLQEPTVSCVSAPSQRAALAALVGPQESVAGQREDLRRRRDHVLARLRSAGRASYTPAGAFYLLVDVRPHEDRNFALALLERHGVAVAPGSAFGKVSCGFVRICYAAGGERLLEGVERLLASL